MIDMIARTRRFALDCLRIADSLPRFPGSRSIAHQLARSGTSIAANYRAAQRGRSRPEFRAKLQIAMEEADESHFWLELIAEAVYVPLTSLTSMIQEANELTAILVASLKKARER
jgi:four helix bundle protein